MEKGIVIGGSSSSSKPTPTKADKGEGKSVVIEKLKEERKAEIVAEMEKQRHIQSILKLRQNDPPTLNKGDPRKLHSYENIEAMVVHGEMHNFQKKPKKSYAIDNSDLNQLDFPINKMMYLTSQY